MFPSKFLQFPSILTHFHAANEKIQNGGRDLAISRGLVWVNIWDGNCAQAMAYIFDWWMNALEKQSKFWGRKFPNPDGTWNIYVLIYKHTVKLLYNMVICHGFCEKSCNLLTGYWVKLKQNFRWIWIVNVSCYWNGPHQRLTYWSLKKGLHFADDNFNACCKNLFTFKIRHKAIAWSIVDPNTLKRKCSSGWQPWYSLETLKTSFNISSEYQGCQPDDLSVSVHHMASPDHKEVRHFWPFVIHTY